MNGMPVDATVPAPIRVTAPTAADSDALNPGMTLMTWVSPRSFSKRYTQESSQVVSLTHFEHIQNAKRRRQ